MFITPFRRAGRHEVAPTASAVYFRINIPQINTFFNEIQTVNFVNIYSHYEKEKIFVLFYGIFVLFRKSAFFAQKWAFFALKSTRKFTTSDFVKTTSEVILTTSDLVLTTFELVFAIFWPKKGRNRVVPPL